MSEVATDDPEPSKRRGRGAQPRTVTRYQQLGAMPTDALAANLRVHASLAVTYYNVERDPTLTEMDRVDTLCSIAARMASLTPMSRIALAEAAVLGQLGDGKGPKLEKVKDAPEVSRIDPTDSGPPARRGRPRKRSVR